MMMSRSLVFVLSLLAYHASAQVVADFEEIGLNMSGFQQDASPNSAFASGDVRLPNFWDPVFQYWEGWAISAVKDNKTPGYQNQYSAIPGQGAVGSDHYAVGYVFGEGIIAIAGASQGQLLHGLWITNSTYAYYSMRDGDAFAKKFGGASGSDPDFFRVTFRSRWNGVTGSDSVTVYLADFRSPDPAKDTLLDGWHWVDLSGLGPADTLVLNLASSDVGGFGMNTPAYVCIDRVTTSGGTSVLTDPTSGQLAMYPNPSAGMLHIKGAIPGDRVELSDVHGRYLRSLDVPAERHLDISSLPSGSYLLRLVQPSGISAGWLIRQ